MPRARSSPIRARRCSTSESVRAAVGSSITITTASVESARAIITSWRSAGRRRAIGTDGSMVTPSSARWRAEMSRAVARSQASLPPSRPRVMLSATLSCSTTLSSWNTNERPAACASWRPWNRRAVPRTRISPVSGSWTPARILISVDLPAPFSPTRQWTSPARRSRSTPRRAWTPGNRFSMALSSRTGSMVMASVGRVEGGAWPEVQTRGGKPPATQGIRATESGRRSRSTRSRGTPGGHSGRRG